MSREVPGPEEKAVQEKQDDDETDLYLPPYVCYICLKKLDERTIESSNAAASNFANFVRRQMGTK